LVTLGCPQCAAVQRDVGQGGDVGQGVLPMVVRGSELLGDMGSLVQCGHASARRCAVASWTPPTGRRGCCRQVSYGKIIVTWCRQHGISPLTAAAAHGLTQQQVADQWNEFWPNPERPKSHKQISYWEAESDNQAGTHSTSSPSSTAVAPACCSVGRTTATSIQPHTTGPAALGVSRWKQSSRLGGRRRLLLGFGSRVYGVVGC